MRTVEQLRRHYEIERELAHKLRSAHREERRYLYSQVYDELFRRVPDHPQLSEGHELRKAWTSDQLATLRRFLRPETTFLEIGAGDCSLSIAAAPLVGRVYAVDVSAEIAPRGHLPPNLEFVISDGCSIPVEAGSVDVAYSNQLMEHLHPDDATEQLLNIYTALRTGGVYICITPHRFSGPHDISMDFDEVATGFHLKEYTNSELVSLFKGVGFSSIRSLLEYRHRQVLVPSAVPMAVERVLSGLPANRRRALARSPLRKLLNIAMVAAKGAPHSARREL